MCRCKHERDVSRKNLPDAVGRRPLRQAAWMSPRLEGAPSPRAGCCLLSRILAAKRDGSWARPAPVPTCLLVISCYPSSCPSALGLFRFRLQSATELNLPSETSRPWRGRHKITRCCCAPVAGTSRSVSSTQRCSYSNSEPQMPHPAPIPVCKSQASLPPLPPCTSFLENTWLLPHPPSHSYTADEGFGCVWSHPTPQTPIFRSLFIS